MYKEITSCRLCGNETFKPVLDLKEQYVVDFVSKIDESLLKAPLFLVRCGSCNLVQLKHSVDANRLYKKFWYRSSTNEQMRLALEKIVGRAEEVVTVQEGDKVLDIGSNDGALLGWYPGNVVTVGVDPCAELVEESLKAQRVDVGLKGFFSKALVEPHGPFKVITAIAMFYDVDDPVGFLVQCKDVLRQDGVLIIQMNYLSAMLRNLAVDNICHEHVAYYSMQTMELAAGKAGLEIVGAETNDVNGGSVRVYMVHKDSGLYGISSTLQFELFASAMNILHREKMSELDTDIPYRKFRDAVVTTLGAVQLYVATEAARGGKIYLYGASTRGTVLTQMLNLPDGVIRGVAERDSNKYNLHMVGGTWPKIYPEDYVRRDATHMLVLPWHFEESILKREQDWIGRGGKLIIPLPEPKVISHDGVEGLIKQTTRVGVRQ